MKHTYWLLFLCFCLCTCHSFMKSIFAGNTILYTAFMAFHFLFIGVERDYVQVTVRVWAFKVLICFCSNLKRESNVLFKQVNVYFLANLLNFVRIDLRFAIRNRAFYVNVLFVYFFLNVMTQAFNLAEWMSTFKTLCKGGFRETNKAFIWFFFLFFSF